jgi:hypothetical protein
MSCGLLNFATNVVVAAQIFPWSNNQKVIQNMNDFPIGHIPLTNPFQNRTKQLKNLTSQCTTLIYTNTCCRNLPSAVERPDVVT